MHYQDVSPISRKEAESAFISDDPQALCDALIRVTYHDLDWRWVQDKCILFSAHSNPEIRGLAATCIGHLARIHKAIDIKKVMPVLQNLLKDPLVSGRASDAIEDIRMFSG